MAFKLLKGLERALLLGTSALIIAGAPLGAPSSCFAQNSSYSISFTKDKSVSITATKGPAYLEIIFKMNEPEYLSGKKLDSIYLTPLNQGFSKFVIFSPKEVKISKVEQEAYFLPQEKFVKLVPLSKAKFAKKVLKMGETLIDSITPWFVINPVKDAKDNLIESSKEKEKKEYSDISKKLENEFGREYSFENIEFFQAEKVRGNERIRKIRTFFDAKELDGKGYIVAKFRSAIGTSSSEVKVGKWDEIGFFLQGEKLPRWIKKQEIGAESILNSDSVRQILQKRTTADVGVYDFQRKKTIIYSLDIEELNKLKRTKEERLRAEILSSIEKDLRKERFSDQTTIFLIELGLGLNEITINEFYNLCKNYEKRF